MRALSRDDFADAVGCTFQVSSESGAGVELTLETAEELPSSGRSEGSFRLEFRGPREPLLPQAIYSLVRGEARYDVFIVPVGQGDRGTVYEAIFY